MLEVLNTMMNKERLYKIMEEQLKGGQ